MVTRKIKYGEVTELPCTNWSEQEWQEYFKDLDKRIADCDRVMLNRVRLNDALILYIAHKKGIK